MLVSGREEAETPTIYLQICDLNLCPELHPELIVLL